SAGPLGAPRAERCPGDDTPPRGARRARAGARRRDGAAALEPAARARLARRARDGLPDARAPQREGRGGRPLASRRRAVLPPLRRRASPSPALRAMPSRGRGAGVRLRRVGRGGRKAAWVRRHRPPGRDHGPVRGVPLVMRLAALLAMALALAGCGGGGHASTVTVTKTSTVVRQQSAPPSSQDATYFGSVASIKKVDSKSYLVV